MIESSFEPRKNKFQTFKTTRRSNDMKGKIVFFVVLSFLLSGAIVDASNMGFKLTYTLTYNTNGKSWFGLPYNMVSITNASEFKTDIGGTCSQIVRYKETSGSFDVWTAFLLTSMLFFTCSV